MTRTIVVVESLQDFAWTDLPENVVAARDYLSQRGTKGDRNTRVVNLCRRFDYLSLGYYVSLLAEARQQRIMPSVSTILDLSRRTLYGIALDTLGDEIATATKDLPGNTPAAFSLFIFFGQTDDPRFANLGRKLFDVFRAPALKVEIRRQEKGWHLGNVRLSALDDLTMAQQTFFHEAFLRHVSHQWRSPKARPAMRYDLAILTNPNEAMPPSDSRALQKFVKAGESLGVEVELIQRKDFSHLAEYDALFIRETTALDHHTYRFAKKAAMEGMPVIDDPDSILKCTNKVYLAELLRASNVPIPKTVVIDKSNLARIEQEFQFPLILKIPDGSFSRGVVKVENPGDLKAKAAELMKNSALIVAQEFMYTDFDWRVGVLNRQPIFVSQYFMSKGHWQIYNHRPDGKVADGSVQTYLVADAPKEVVDVAVKAAGLIGDGLYGVDLKQNADGVVVIEINDNPSIEHGCEDMKLKDDLYRIVIEDFVRRLEAPGARWRTGPTESPI